MAQALEQFLIFSGLAPQSIDKLRGDFPRWERFLRSKGITAVPSHPWFGEAQAVNLVNALINQSSPNRANQELAHELRDLTGIRPRKPPTRHSPSVP